MPLTPTQKGQRGFSLIEIFVGMTIGLIIVLIIYGVVSTYEGIKRTTTSTAATQQTGLFSLFAVERDIRMAGWGLPSADIMSCGQYFTYVNDGTTSGAVPDFPDAPVRIVDGGSGAGASDSITVLWGSSVRANVRNALLQNVVAVPEGAPAAELQPTTTVALSRTGDFAWLTDDLGQCALVQITGTAANVASPGNLVLSHTSGTGTAEQPSYNPAGAYLSSAGWPASYSANPRIFDVGALMQRTYAVAAGSLVSKDYFSAIEQAEIGNNVVALKAQYGISAAGGQAVTGWVSATNSAAGNWATPSVTELKRIKAVRLAVVVRSPLKERVKPGATACNETTTAPPTWTGAPALDLSNDADWKCHRYRTFQTVVPLRNVLWANLK